MKIKNCQIKYKCDKTWETLAETSSPNIKYCLDCDRGVHYCKNESELIHALNQDRCIAMGIIDDNYVRRKFVGKMIIPPIRDPI